MVKKPALNVFTNAPLIAPKTTKGKKNIAEHEITGLQDLAALDALIDSLKAVRETISNEVKIEAVETVFYPEAIKHSKRPENFRGTEGQSSASVELRKRGSNSPLKPEEINILEEHDIPVARIGEMLLVNPTYLNDTALLAKVSEALGAVKDFPADFFQRDVGKPIVSDQTFEAAFNLNENALKSVLPIVSLTAIKPTWEGKDTDAIKAALKLIGVEIEVTAGHISDPKLGDKLRKSLEAAK